jgi:metal-responsive CopG/Arc/MetJ family transcriptional regulator
MARKTEIKVYLPDKLVGELEARRKAGIRSKFIAEAIRAQLDRRSEASPFDFELIHLLATCRDKVMKLSATQLTMSQSALLCKLIQLIIDELRD